jgi:hypothetical protein
MTGDTSNALAVLSLIVALGEFIIICFMIPMIKTVHSIDKRLMSKQDIQDQIDLTIYRHMNKCAGHKKAHDTEENKD